MLIRTIELRRSEQEMGGTHKIEGVAGSILTNEAAVIMKSGEE
jgi:hypothetical protein